MADWAQIEIQKSTHNLRIEYHKRKIIKIYMSTKKYLKILFCLHFLKYHSQHRRATWIQKYHFVKKKDVKTKIWQPCF